MLSLDLPTTNILITVAVGGLFVFFIILLMRLNPSTETREDAETEIEVEGQEPQKPLAVRIDSPRIAEKPLVAVSATVTGSSTQTKQESPPSDFSQNREIPKPEKTVAPAKRGCLHHFGYLRTLPKNSPLPDECLGCEKIVECFVNRKSK